MLRSRPRPALSRARSTRRPSRFGWTTTPTAVTQQVLPRRRAPAPPSRAGTVGDRHSSDAAVLPVTPPTDDHRTPRRTARGATTCRTTAWSTATGVAGHRRHAPADGRRQRRRRTARRTSSAARWRSRAHERTPAPASPRASSLRRCTAPVRDHARSRHSGTPSAVAGRPLRRLRRRHRQRRARHGVVQRDPVIVDNTRPTGGVATPAAGASVQRHASRSTTDAGDATSASATCSGSARPNGDTGWANIGAAITSAANGYQRNWNTAAGAVGDGPDFVRAVITDNAGNRRSRPARRRSRSTTRRRTARPSSPRRPPSPAARRSAGRRRTTPSASTATTSLRGATVIGTVAVPRRRRAYSFNDKNAPDQASLELRRARLRRAPTTRSTPTRSRCSSTRRPSQRAARRSRRATPTAGPPALSWQAPAVFSVAHYDIYRDGLLLGSTTGPQTTLHRRRPRPRARTTTPCSRATPPPNPGVLSASFKVIVDRTPPTSGGAPTAQLLAGRPACS